MNFNGQIQALRTRIDKLSLRERALLLGAILVVLFLLWDSLLMQPLQKERRSLQTRLGDAQTRIAEMEGQGQALISLHRTDPDLENRRRMEELKKEIALLDEQLHAMTVNLVAPREMAKILQNVLAKERGLRLVRLENLPPVPLVERQADGATDSKGLLNIYRHPLRLEFEAGYLDGLGYLKKIEGIPNRFFWEDLEINVLRYPISRFAVTIETLSLQEGWIGV